MKAIKGVYCGLNVVGFSDGATCHIVNETGGLWSFIPTSQVSNMVEFESIDKASTLKQLVGDAKEVNIRF